MASKDKALPSEQEKQKLQDSATDNSFDVRFKSVNFKCSHCCEFFDNTNAFTEHVLAVHPSKVSHSCSACGETFEDDASLQMHKRTHLDTSSGSTTSQPDASLGSTGTSSQRDASSCSTSTPPQHEQDSFKCSKCSITLNSEARLRTHEAECTGMLQDDPVESEQHIGIGTGSGEHIGDADTSAKQTHGCTGEDDIPPGDGMAPKTCKPTSNAVSQPRPDSPTGTDINTATCSKSGVDAEKQKPSDIQKNSIDSSQDTKGDSSAGMGKLLYACIICEQTFSEPDSLIQHHTETHVSSYPCSECGKHFISRPTLERHISRRHKGSQVKTVVKSQTSRSSTKKNMQQPGHTRQKSTSFQKRISKRSKMKSCKELEEKVFTSSKQKKEVQYECSVCKKCYPNRSELESHETCHTDQTYQCKPCDKSFTSLEQLLDHISDDNAHQSQNTCPVCEKVFTFTSSFDAKGHVSSHYGVLMYPCTVCDKRFSSKVSLNAHRNLHKGTYECDECGKHCQSKFILTNHKKTHSNRTKKKVNTSLEQKNDVQYECTVCKKCYPDRSKLEFHATCHTDQTYLCHPCQKSFTSLEQLLDHISDDNDHQSQNTCPVCEKEFTFTNRFDAKGHVSSHYGVLMYPCTVCDKRFSSKVSLTAHSNLHKGTYKCDECGKHCQSTFILKIHKKTHSKPFVCKCELCGKGFKSELRKKRHKCWQRFDCTHCGNSYADEKTLKEHEQRKHGTDPMETYPCAHCGTIFKYKNNMRRHLRDIHSINLPTREKKPEGPFLCTLCGKQYTEEKSLKIHEISVHSAIKPYQCPTCLRRFGAKSTLKIHIAGKHTTNRPHLCTYCGRQFLSKSTLSTHLRIHTNSYPYKCRFCDRPIRYLSNLKDHERVHTGEKPYKCKECGDQFRTQYILYIHINTKHIKEDSPHKCSICNTVCATKSWLNQHMLKHTKPHKCVVCGRGFPTKKRVNEHMLSHTKPHKCDICGRGFPNKSSLTKHQNSKNAHVHSKSEVEEPGKIKPHKCTICGKEFDTNKKINQHMLIHTRPHKCVICGKGFSRKRALKLHQRTHKNFSDEPGEFKIKVKKTKSRKKVVVGAKTMEGSLNGVQLEKNEQADLIDIAFRKPSSVIVQSSYAETQPGTRQDQIKIEVGGHDKWHTSRFSGWGAYPPVWGLSQSDDKN